MKNFFKGLTNTEWIFSPKSFGTRLRKLWLETQVVTSICLKNTTVQILLYNLESYQSYSWKVGLKNSSLKEEKIWRLFNGRRNGRMSLQLKMHFQSERRMRRASRGRKTLKQTINLLQLNEEKINGYHAIVQEITKVNTHTSQAFRGSTSCAYTQSRWKKKKNVERAAVQNVQYLPGPDWKAITADAAPSSTLSLPAICSSFSPNWGGQGSISFSALATFI